MESYYKLSQSQTAKKDAFIFSAFRSAVIQAFEYGYELCIKMLRRQLAEMESSAPVIDTLAYKDLIRTGAEKGLIENPVSWFDFRQKRNITAHTYDEAKAQEVYDSVPLFLTEAARLYRQLNQLR